MAVFHLWSGGIQREVERLHSRSFAGCSSTFCRSIARRLELDRRFVAIACFCFGSELTLGICCKISLLRLIRCSIIYKLQTRHQLICRNRPIGRRGHGYDVLNRRRRLSLTMIQRLHEGLGVPTDVLVQRVRLTSDATGVSQTRHVSNRRPWRRRSQRPSIVARCGW